MITVIKRFLTYKNLKISSISKPVTYAIPMQYSINLDSRSKHLEICNPCELVKNLREMQICQCRFRQLTRERENEHKCLGNEFHAVSISTGQVCSSYLVSNKKEVTAVISLSSLHHSKFICCFIAVTVPD